MDKASWKVSHGGKPFHVKYRHYANELAVRNAHADPTHCFFTPAAILVYNPALAQQVHTIAIKLPQTWTTISTSLPSKDGIYTAPNLDELMDSPFEIGSHQEQTFDMDGVRYRMATYPAARRFTDAHLADVRDVVHQANQVFAPEPPPIKEYLFITHLNNGGGGLEHKFGSVLQGNVAILTDKKQFNGFLSLVAHEYFHLWNVKRIRPRRLGPFDYQQENYTTTLWFAEGVTSYYDDLIATRAGKYTPDEYLNTLAGGINNAGTIQGWRLQSLESASYDAWIKYYRPNENSQNATVNYYTQGSVVGWAMDMHIRALTKGAKNLDNLMLNLWKKAKDNADFYADRQAIAQAMTEVCGTDQAAWLEGLVAKPALPEIENLALGVGLLPIDHRKDKFWPSLGMGQQRAGDKIVVGAIYRGGPAEKAGVLVGDVLVKLEDKPLTEPYKEDELPYVEYQSVAVDILRQGEPIRLMLNVAPSPRMRWQLNMATKRSPVLQGWLDKK
jgi:predicted metalloprotease with PDZ domain